MSRLGLIKRLQHYLRVRKDSGLAAVLRSDALHVETLEPRLLLSGTVEGQVWHDLNENGTHEPDEPGMAAVKVYIDLNHNYQHDQDEPFSYTDIDNPNTSEIDESGHYQITDVPEGDQIISVETPYGFNWPTSHPLFHVASGSYETILSSTPTDIVRNVDMAISNDGKFIYITDYTDDKIEVFGRNAEDGLLQRIQALTAGQDGLTEFDAGFRITLSHHERFLYISGSGSTIYTFERDLDTGYITYIDTISAESDSDPIHLISDIRALKVSPDNQYLYASGDDNDGLVAFSINPQTGVLSYHHHFVDESILNKPVDIDFSMDNRFVYVVGQISHTVAIFERDAETDNLSVIQILRFNEFGLDRLFQVNRIIISPDGRFAYTASSSGLVSFERDQQTGRLGKIQHIESSESFTLNDINSIAISPDGKSLVAGTWAGDTVSTLLRNTETGLLTPSIVHHSFSSPELDLNSVRVVKISPDNQHLYALANANPSVMTFKLDRSFGFSVSVTSGQVADGVDIGLLTNDDYYDQFPNNTQQTAFDLSIYPDVPLSEIQGLGQSHDEDWYQINIPEDEPLLVVNLISNFAQDLNLELYRYDQQPMFVDIDSTENSKSFEIELNEGRYYIRITGNDNGETYDLIWNKYQSGKVHGLIWNDLNQDQLRNPGEPGLAGWTVYADLDDNGRLDPFEPYTLTSQDDPNTPDIDETGQYTLIDVPNEEVIIRRIVPDLWKSTYPDLSSTIGNGYVAHVSSHADFDYTSTDRNTFELSEDGKHLYVGNPSGELLVYQTNEATGQLTLVQHIESHDTNATGAESQLSKINRV